MLKVLEENYTKEFCSKQIIDHLLQFDIISNISLLIWILHQEIFVQFVGRLDLLICHNFYSYVFFTTTYSEEKNVKNFL